MEVMRCMDSKSVCLSAELTIQGTIGGMHLANNSYFLIFQLTKPLHFTLRAWPYYKVFLAII